MLKPFFLLNYTESDVRSMKKYTVYIHINKINNKCYVGIITQKPENRWQKGKGYNTQDKFYNAIQKYGWGNFDHKIIAQNLSEDEACKLEQKLIQKYNAIKEGYNSNEGGKGCLGHIVSPEARLKMSEWQKGKKRGPRSEETKLKIASKLKGRKTYKVPWNLGRKCSEEEKILIRKRAKEAAMRVVAKKVKCIETNIIYNSLTEASEATGIATCNICGAASGKRHTAGKLHWVYIEN